MQWVNAFVRVSVFPGELCEEKLDFCAPELNPCQHDSKCILTPQGYKWVTCNTPTPPHTRNFHHPSFPSFSFFCATLTSIHTSKLQPLYLKLKALNFRKHGNWQNVVGPKYFLVLTMPNREQQQKHTVQSLFGFTFVTLLDDCVGIHLCDVIWGPSRWFVTGAKIGLHLHLVLFCLQAAKIKTLKKCVLVCFRCECTPGYVGEHCESDYNDCEENKCQNGGQCIDAINGYTCVCPEGYR